MYILRKIRIDLACVIIVGIAINMVANRLESRLPEMPLTIAMFLGTAISILLSFKMNQSYDRWWEARKVWGAIVNDSRSFIIQLQSFLNAEKNHDFIRTAAYRQIAWCYSLGYSLRGLNPMIGAEEYLSGEEIRNLAAHSNKPLAMIQTSAREIAALRERGELDVFRQVQLDDTLVRLCDSMGKAERINNTVFPTTYRIFLHLAIYLFVIILSIALQNVSIIYEIPLLASISAIFFLLEKTATHLQDPFRNRPSDTPVTAIARGIEINLKQLLNEKDIPKPLPPDGFYLM